MSAYYERPVEQRIASLAAVPIELRQQPQWVGFQLKPNGEKLEKMPFIAPDAKRKARCNGRDTWRDFNTAVDGLQHGRYNAVGYALAGDVFAIDLDHCLDRQRAPSAFAAGILASVRTYTEVSASGRGLHLFGLGPIHRSIRGNSLELYGDRRFIVVTGDRFTTTPSELRQFAADELSEALEHDAPVIREIRSNCCLIPSDLSNLSNNLTVDQLIAKTLPMREGERNRRIFDFARGMKFDLGMAAYPLATLRPIVRRWHDRALPTIETKDFDDTWADFTIAWQRARLPLSGGTLEKAIELAGSSPLPPEAAEYDSLAVQKLVAVCCQLQRMNGCAPFYLSGYSAAEFMGVTQPTAWKYLYMLRAAGVLKVETQGNQRQANRYRYVAAADGDAPNAETDPSNKQTTATRSESEEP